MHDFLLSIWQWFIEPRFSAITMVYVVGFSVVYGAAMRRIRKHDDSVEDVAVSFIASVIVAGTWPISGMFLVITAVAIAIYRKVTRRRQA